MNNIEQKILIPIILLVLVSSFVSAGFFGDIWNKITGEATILQPVIESTNLEGLYSVRSEKVVGDAPNCEVSGEENYDPLKEGRIISPIERMEICGGGGGELGKEFYSEGYLVEYYCDSNGYAHEASVQCYKGCKDGICLEQQISTAYFCKDSDGGINYDIKGQINELKYAGNDIVLNITSEDSCTSTSLNNGSWKERLIEYYCKKETGLPENMYLHSFEEYPCPRFFACEKGLCVKQALWKECHDIFGRYVEWGVYEDGILKESGVASPECVSETERKRYYCKASSASINEVAYRIDNCVCEEGICKRPNEESPKCLSYLADGASHIFGGGECIQIKSDNQRINITFIKVENNKTILLVGEQTITINPSKTEIINGLEIMVHDLYDKEDPRLDVAHITIINEVVEEVVIVCNQAIFGQNYALKSNECLKIGSKKLTLREVQNDKTLIDFDGVRVFITKGTSEVVNGIGIKVGSLLNQAGTENDAATITITESSQAPTQGGETGEEQLPNPLQNENQGPTPAGGTEDEQPSILLQNETKKGLTPSEEKCQGCLHQEKCLPYGTRKELENIPMYCDLTKSRFRPQLNNGVACENGYECKSNECSNGKCIYPYGLLKRIWCWVTNLFDKEGRETCLIGT